MRLAIYIGFIRVGGSMTRNNHVGERQELMVGGERLRLGDVESRASDFPRYQRIVQRVGVHQTAPGAIDQIGGVFHRLKLSGAEYLTSLLRQRSMDADKIGRFDQLVMGHELHSEVMRDLGSKIRIHSLDIQL